VSSTDLPTSAPPIPPATPVTPAPLVTPGQTASPARPVSPDALAAPDYAGLATRAIAFVIDAALILVVELLVSVSGVVIVGVLKLPHAINAILAILGGCLAIAWSVGYFVAFWSATGQTPGSRVMQIRVLADSGNLLRPRRAVVRCIGLLLAALPLFAGYVPILFDRRRRGFQDWLARTVVVHTRQLSIAAARRAAARGNGRSTPPPG
jgi:uncharacterized RDD family membrane protein YckC